MIVLSLNAGSSSLKFALHRFAAREERLAEGAVEGIGSDRSRTWLRDGTGRSLDPPAHATTGHRDHAAAVRAVFESIDGLDLSRPDAVGHRFVHGGPAHFAPERVDDRLLAELRGLVPFAPLHLPIEIRAVEAVATRYPGLPQVVCFDTAFHRSMPPVARRFALPRALHEAGILRYGFHGLSYEFVVGKLAELGGPGKLGGGPGGNAFGRAVIAHLGNGASMAAVLDGEPIDTTMGFTPAGGFMMGTRSGDLDPGVLVHLAAHRGYDAPALEKLVNHESGLLGVSGTTAQMEVLLARRAGDARAAEAIALFCYQARKSIGALAAALGGLDVLVFTGGIGERAAPVREEICAGLEFLGIRIDRARNAAHADVVSAPDATCSVRVVATDENLTIARHTHAIVRS